MGSDFSILCFADEVPDRSLYPSYPYERPRSIEADARRHIRRKPDAAISPGDVYALHRMLSSAGKLPAELVLYIVQLADYHAPVKTCRKDQISILWTNCPRESLARLYLLTPPVPAFGAWRRAKKVVWVLDNNMVNTSDRPYADAWLEACIFRRTREPPRGARDIADIERLYWFYKSPERMARHLRIARAGWSLVRNGDKYGWLLPPNREYCKQVVEWYPDSSSSLRGNMGEAAEAGADGGGFVEALQPGDRVGLWMRLGHKGLWNWLYGARFEIVYGDY
ncbi:hypothetical protein LXA43DRAFT_896175 [Ganoderma leucocontextum]|nr:hypothetical protein LXA43DRAFT_896175 [Ganoderma leucocontextum]